MPPKIQAKDDHACHQEMRLGEIGQAIRFFQEAELRREAREQRMLQAMETVAAQGEVIKSHAEALTRHDKAITTLYDRLRDVEKEPAATVARPFQVAGADDAPPKSLVIRLLDSRAGVYLIGIIVFNFAVNCVVNFDVVAKLLWLVK